MLRGELCLLGDLRNLSDRIIQSRDSDLYHPMYCDLDVLDYVTTSAGKRLADKGVADSWSRNGHKLLSASTDNNVCIWEVMTGDCEQKYRFPSPILKVQFNPRNDKVFLVCPMRHAVVLVNSEGGHQVVPLDDDSDLNIVASFDRRGEFVYTGNGRGKVSVLTVSELSLKASFKVTQGTTSATAVKSIEFARRGDCFLINTADRVIRVYDTKEVLACGKDGETEPIQKLQDLVNKTGTTSSPRLSLHHCERVNPCFTNDMAMLVIEPGTLSSVDRHAIDRAKVLTLITMWKKCCFSGDGEYICAGSARQHAIYIWEKSIGNLVKILHGTKGELLLDVVWHPVRPIVASISSGVVSVWAQNQVENWSAFAPDFKELDENVEYEERESEFDLSDKDKLVELGPKQEDDDFEFQVDACSIDPVAAFCSSDEEKEDTDTLEFLPIAPEVEDPEDGWAAPPPPTVLPQHKEWGDNNSPSLHKYRTYDIELKGAPSDEIHPLLSNKTKDKQQNGNKKNIGRPRMDDRKRFDT
uniref:Retinoblastoma-binding protein 5 n=1 Tax=Timema cristinae TaxID=61476 RepID=A0A7R9GWT8_TIMCR|nr:unnamed protein product [Timema cristinae]